MLQSGLKMGFNEDIDYFLANKAINRVDTFSENLEKPGIWKFVQKNLENLEFEKCWIKPEKPGILNKNH